MGLVVACCLDRYSTDRAWGLRILQCRPCRTERLIDKEGREMGGFILTGTDIEIRYRTHDDNLSVQGEGLPLGDGPFTFTGDEITQSESVDGRILTVVLLESSRNGTQVRLNVIFPEVSGSASDQEITGAAIIVSDGSDAVGGPPAVRQLYDVRSLSGTKHAG